MATTQRSTVRIKISAVYIFLIMCISAQAQNVGIGTIYPQYKLDVRTRIDTTLQVRSVGISSLVETAATRIGILNVMDSTTAGSRIGIATNIAFSNSVAGPLYQYIGHDIAFDGYCFPTGNGCNESNIYGIKVDIPIFANDGEHYGVYASVPRLTGYAGYFAGRGHFSRMVGIGVEPNAFQNLFVKTESTAIYPIHRSARIQLITESTVDDVESIFVETLGSSSGTNYAGKFKTTALDGEGIGIYSSVQTSGGGDSHGIYAENMSTQGVYRNGITCVVSGNGTGTIRGIYSHITGNSTNARPVTGVSALVDQFATTSTVTGVRGTISENATTGNSYALYGSNLNGGHSALLYGRVLVSDGHDASLSSDGYLQLGVSNSTNVVYDNNEIIARDNGAAAPLYLQHSSGDVLLCGQEQGKVGIGITSTSGLPPGYLLAVDGKGIFEEIRVELSGAWPDYVFEDNYRLMPLKDVRTFIENNGHLPNIPSAEDISQNGQMLGEVQRLMLEKIEELTLYVLRQDEEIQALRSELRQVIK